MDKTHFITLIFGQETFYNLIFGQEIFYHLFKKKEIFYHFTSCAFGIWLYHQATNYTTWFSFSFLEYSYALFLYKFWVLLTSVSGTLFKHTKISNYHFKKSNISISNAIITCIFINTCYLCSLKSAPGTLVNISP